MLTRVQADLVCCNCGTPNPWYAEHPDRWLKHRAWCRNEGRCSA